MSNSFEATRALVVRAWSILECLVVLYEDDDKMDNLKVDLSEVLEEISLNIHDLMERVGSWDYIYNIKLIKDFIDKLVILDIRVIDKLALEYYLDLLIHELVRFERNMNELAAVI